MLLLQDKAFLEERNLQLGGDVTVASGAVRGAGRGAADTLAVARRTVEAAVAPLALLEAQRQAAVRRNLPGNRALEAAV